MPALLMRLSGGAACYQAVAANVRITLQKNRPAMRLGAAHRRADAIYFAVNNWLQK
jgi:hypothetical protein